MVQQEDWSTLMGLEKMRARRNASPTAVPVTTPKRRESPPSPPRVSPSQHSQLQEKKYPSSPLARRVRNKYPSYISPHASPERLSPQTSVLAKDGTSGEARQEASVISYPHGLKDLQDTPGH